MNGTSAYPFAGVIRAEGKRVGAAGHSKILPVEFMRAGFVADPVFLSVPEGAGFQAYHGETGARQTLQQDSASGADSDDDIVNSFHGFFLKLEIWARCKASVWR